MRYGKGTDEVDFIEVHIYGSLNRRSIERVSISKQELEIPEELLLVDSLRRKLSEVGASVEVY